MLVHLMLMMLGSVALALRVTPALGYLSYGNANPLDFFGDGL